MRPLRVLIADDEPDALTTLGMLLTAEGIEVRLASRGLQVARLVAEFAPDAVILDLALPDHSGLEVARELAKTYGKDCPVLVCVTGRAGDEERAREAGFRHFVVKPYEPRELVRLVLSLPLRTASVIGYITPAAAKLPISDSP
jgi:DNA-binding response OmpR family regulator